MSGTDDPSSGSRIVDDAVKRALERAIEQLDEVEREDDEQRGEEEERPESSQERAA